MEALIQSATTPESLFGPLDGPDLEARLKLLDLHFRKAAKAIHPDKVSVERKAEATLLFAKLSALHTKAKQKLQAGAYGQKEPETVRLVKSPAHLYRLSGPPTAGDVADVYACQDETDLNLVCKIVRGSPDNDLMQAECTALKAFQSPEFPEKDFFRYFPQLHENFQIRDKSGAVRQVNVMRRIQGHVSLEAVMRQYPDGLDYRDTAWMYKRLLACLGHAHRKGFVHGAVLPCHVLVDPIGHGAKLVDWCYSTKGQPLKAMVSRFDGFYPPEVKAKKPVTSATDIYMATVCVSWLTDANVPTQIRSFWQSCLLKNPAARPDDAWALHEEFDQLLSRLVGRPRYRKLEMPMESLS